MHSLPDMGRKGDCPMKTSIYLFALLALPGSFLTPPAVAYASPSPADSAHFCRVIDAEEWERERSLRPAAKPLADLNIGEPRTVRLFYFLPNDRPYRAEVVEAMKTGILEVQSFFSEQMEAHGHGDKTFKIETDAQGTPVVHRVDGDSSASHYAARGYTEGEITRAFDNSANIQCILMDIDRTYLHGIGSGNKTSGWAIIYGEWNWFAAAHEIGHALGLPHDFRQNSYVMSYGLYNRSSATLSEAAAGFLSVHPYFNSAIPLERGSLPTFELLSSTEYPLDATSVPVRIRAKAENGLHMIIILVNTKRLLGDRGREVKASHTMEGKTDTVFSFDYDGLTPSDKEFTATGYAYTSLSDPLQHQISFLMVDEEGNNNGTTGYTPITLEAVQKEVVPVSERTPQVAEAILGRVRSNDPSVSSYTDITESHLGGITALDLSDKGITALKDGDFEGLASLTQLNLNSNQLSLLRNGIFDNLTALKELALVDNQLSSLPDGVFGNLTALTHLGLGDNQLSSLPAGIFDGLTALIFLGLGDNQLSSLPPGILDELTALRHLVLSDNQFSSLPAGIFDELTALIVLTLADNQFSSLPAGIFDELTALEHLGLGDNQLSSLPDGVFDNLNALTNLSLTRNALSSLPAGIFDELTMLTTLSLGENQFSALPRGIFEGLPLLTVLYLSSNLVNPLPLDVSLQKVVDGQFKAVAPAGVTFDLVLPIRIRNGSISGGATTLTIPVGSVESDTLTVTRTTGTSGAVSVWIGELPGLPANHTGYKLVKTTGDFHPLEIFEDISEQIWFGTITIGSWGNAFGNGNATGYGYSSRHNAGSISNSTFTYKGVTYTIHGFGVSVLGDIPNARIIKRVLTISPGFPSCDKDLLRFLGFQLSDASTGSAYGSTTYNWPAIGNQFLSIHENPFSALIALHPTVPDAPTVTAANDGNQVTLSWTTCDGGKDITRHEYQQKTTSGTFGSWIPIPNSGAGGVNAASYTLTGVNNPQEQIFEVRAVNELGDGSISAPVSPSDRTPQVAAAILSAVRQNDPNVVVFADITDSHLAAITTLFLGYQNITALKPGDFSGLTALTRLNLPGNQLSSLPDSIFEGLTALTQLLLGGNSVQPLPLTVSLEKVADGQFKAVALAGAPFEIVLPLSLTNGTIDGDATTITIPAGSVDSGPLTVTRTSGTTAAVTVDIGTLPGLPNGHFGYALVKSNDLPLEVISEATGEQATTDFNGDGRTDFADFFLFIEGFGGMDSRFDLDGSGTVDFVDFFLLIEAFNPLGQANPSSWPRPRR